MPLDARTLAADALVDVERGRIFAREAVAARRDALADARDRALLQRIVFDTVRRRATLDAVLDAASRRPLADLDPFVRAAMRAALAQAFFSDRIPASAAPSRSSSRNTPRGICTTTCGSKSAGS